VIERKQQRDRLQHTFDVIITSPDDLSISRVDCRKFEVEWRNADLEVYQAEFNERRRCVESCEASASQVSVWLT
jgi:hypothetical protein